MGMRTETAERSIGVTFLFANESVVAFISVSKPMQVLILTLTLCKHLNTLKKIKRFHRFSLQYPSMRIMWLESGI